MASADRGGTPCGGAILAIAACAGAALDRPPQVSGVANRFSEHFGSFVAAEKDAVGLQYSAITDVDEKGRIPSEGKAQ